MAESRIICVITKIEFPEREPTEEEKKKALDPANFSGATLHPLIPEHSGQFGWKEDIHVDLRWNTTKKVGDIVAWTFDNVSRLHTVIVKNPTPLEIVMARKVLGK